MKLEMLEPVHRTSYRVLYGDTDAGGVVYYAGYLRLFEMGRTEFMRDLVVAYRTLHDQGLILPVVECYSRYKASAIYDDLLVIETSLVEVKNVSCRFHYRILRKKGPRADTLLVKGATTHASVDRNGKLTRLPADLLNTLRGIRPPAE